MDLFGFWGEGQSAPSRGSSGAYSELSHKVDLILRTLQVEPGIFEDNTLPAHVRQSIASGRKIEAIKEYRDYANCGLKEAKDAVEGIGGPSPWVVLNRKMDRILAELGIEQEKANVPGLTPSQTAEVEEMVRAGNTLGTIMVYREHTGASLTDAQTIVYQVAARLQGRDDV